jgi:hypothetical protein
MAMNLNLADLQSMLYRLITAPGGPSEAGAQHVLGDRGLEAVISVNSRLSADQRVGIYADAYFYRLHDVLKEDFPCTYRIVGDVNFHNLITGYLIEYPPSEPSVLYAGRHLPHYLRRILGEPGGSFSKWPFVADVARLERACIEVFHGADADALESSSLRDLAPESWPSLKIRLHPAAQILDLKWRIDMVMEAIKRGPPWEPPTHEPVAILIWRQDWQARYRALEAGECAALKTAAAGSDFASICGALANELEAANEVPDLAAIINRLLIRWLDDGLLACA